MFFSSKIELTGDSYLDGGTHSPSVSIFGDTLIFSFLPLRDGFQRQISFNGVLVDIARIHHLPSVTFPYIPATKS